MEESQEGHRATVGGHSTRKQRVESISQAGSCLPHASLDATDGPTNGHSKAGITLKSKAASKVLDLSEKKVGLLVLLTRCSHFAASSTQSKKVQQIICQTRDWIEGII